MFPFSDDYQIDNIDALVEFITNNAMLITDFGFDLSKKDILQLDIVFRKDG